MAFNSWVAKNPELNPGFWGQTRWEAHVWGRQTFAKSFASGGFASTVFAQDRAEMLINPWRRKAHPGSPQYIENLRKLQKLHPNSTRIQKAIDSARLGKARGVGGMLLGAGATAGIIIGSGLMEEGPLHEKARAATSAVGMEIGFAVGAKAGAGIGAAIGSVVPVVGTALGAVVGGLGGGLVGAFAGGEATDFLTRIPDRIVDRERSRRSLDWGVHTKAFQTQRAHTMRQQSLAAMNRGQMSARSLLGQEAVFVHR